MGPNCYHVGDNIGKKYKDGIKGYMAEHAMFKALQKYFKQTGDDVLVVMSHKFLNTSEKSPVSEKDFILKQIS